MLTSLPNRVMSLVNRSEWNSIIAMRDEIEVMAGTPEERAFGLYALGCAYWGLADDPWDYAQSIRYARRAAELHDLGGLAPKVLGTRLITLGIFAEGTRVLQALIAKWPSCSAMNDAHLCDVQYSLGYAAQYQYRYSEAELWYRAAMSGYEKVGDERCQYLSACALAEVLAKMGRNTEARSVLDRVPPGKSCEGYRLKALVEILYSERELNAATEVGERASEALLSVDDPWELVELHTLLANIQHQAGNYAERDKHLEVVETALRLSPRHDLYAKARLLLNLDWREVAV